PGNGGGLCIAYDGIAELNNVTISGNTAANYGGGIFSCLNCKLLRKSLSCILSGYCRIDQPEQ
ncbi:MAG: hypothetical protein D3904_11920, partial [Candidatus Electrothrix sp. EH2]|nr:hypothetical protein [Candidatus Electrothrix sp. EH2]